MQQTSGGEAYSCAASCGGASVKHSGECGVTGSIPAVLNAVNDALARAGAATAIGLPATPEKIWRCLRGVNVAKVKRRG